VLNTVTKASALLRYWTILGYKLKRKGRGMKKNSKKTAKERSDIEQLNQDGKGTTEAGVKGTTEEGGIERNS
jgi:hypothetical protein